MRRSYYSPLTYSLTKLALDGVLLRALPAILFAVPFYFLMGLSPGAGPFLTFAFVFIAFNATVGALALSLAAALDSPGKTVRFLNACDVRLIPPHACCLATAVPPSPLLL